MLLPARGTVPGMTVEYIKDLVDFAHENGCMTMTTIGTSQEGQIRILLNLLLYTVK